MTLTSAEVASYYRLRAPGIQQRTGREWRGPCPIHHGQRDSFSVDPKTGCWHCHSACGRGGDIPMLEKELSGLEIGEALAVVRQLIGRPNESGNGNRSKNGKKREPVAVYEYLDESGRHLFDVCRYDPKDFRQRRRGHNGAWIWETKDVRRVLYRLPDLARASQVAIVEGEKDAERFSAYGTGIVATCNSGGAGKWRTEYAESLEGKICAVIPDADLPGRRHAMQVLQSLLPAAKQLYILELPEGNKDFSDWSALNPPDTDAGRQAFRDLVKRAEEVDKQKIAELRTRWGLTGDEHQPNEEALPKQAEAASQEPKPKRSRHEGWGVSFEVTEKAVLFHDTESGTPTAICSRLEVAAKLRSRESHDWGALLKWTDEDGVAHEWAMPYSFLAGDGSEYRAHLLAGGLKITPGTKPKNMLTAYLQTAQTDQRARCVSRVGWDRNSFVLPNETIGDQAEERVVFQGGIEGENLLTTSGTLEEWRDQVGRCAAGNSRLVLAISAAFAGPLLSMVGAESGGLHFVGPTSSGKSTALIVGGSVIGGGGRLGFTQNWRATMNGLEAIAAAHNDLTLFLDELSQIDPREAAETAYLLGNGSGKARMSRAITTRKKLSWTLLFVSAGEVTLEAHALSAGKRLKGGAEVRLLNVSADAGAGLGMFEDLHGSGSPDAFSRQLKDAARRFYGTPLRPYLRYLVDNRTEVERAVRECRDQFLQDYVPANASGEVSRAAGRFALIATAGELATEADVTGWHDGEAHKAVGRIFREWIDSRGGTGAADAEAAIRQVRLFIEQHGASRFQLGDEAVRDRAGFKRTATDGSTEYGILPEVFRSEVTKGFDYKHVVRVLEERGYLRRDKSRDLTLKMSRAGGDVRVFLVRDSILMD